MKDVGRREMVHGHRSPRLNFLCIQVPHIPLTATRAKARPQRVFPNFFNRNGVVGLRPRWKTSPFKALFRTKFHAAQRPSPIANCNHPTVQRSGECNSHMSWTLRSRVHRRLLAPIPKADVYLGGGRAVISGRLRSYSRATFDGV